MCDITDDDFLEIMLNIFRADSQTIDFKCTGSPQLTTITGIRISVSKSCSQNMT